MAAPVERAPDGCDLVRVCESALSHDEAVGFVTEDDCGAVATFLGVTRNNFQGKRVVTLSYEAYTPMAESEMRKICVAARSRFGVKKCCILHRIGEVAVGQSSVIIAAGSPHRADALKAVAWAIDELKTTVPIWKKEIYAEGDATWKQNREWDPRALGQS